MIDFAGLAEAADMRAVASACGLSVDSRNKALCPFHADTHPSLQIYRDGYHCFTCGAHGDAIDLVMHMKNCGKVEAAEEVARISGGEVYAIDTEAQRRETERKRREREYEKALDDYMDADMAVKCCNSLLNSVEPFSLIFTQASKERDIALFKRELADAVILRERFRRYDEKNKGMNNGTVVQNRAMDVRRNEADGQ